jgi:hypothetical protein
MPEYNVAEWVRLNREEGRNFAEIARLHGVTRDVVKNQVHRYKEAPTDEGVPSSLSSVEVMDPHELPEGWEDRLYDNAKEQARLRQATKKQNMVYNIKVTTNLPIMHVWTADWHLLDGGTDHDAFDEDVRLWTTTPGIRLGLGGDYANWFSPAVLPRAMPANTVPSDLTKPIVRKKFLTLKDYIDYVANGNHDEMPAATGWHPIDEICREFKLPNLGPGGRVLYHVGRVTYQIEARHSFNFNSALNDTNSHRQLWSQAGKPDMVFTAHLHNPTLHHRHFDGDDSVWARNGAFKRDDHYAKSKNFVHTQSGPPDQIGVILFPDRKQMIPFRNYRHGLPLLAHLRAQYATLTA